MRASKSPIPSLKRPWKHLWIVCTALFLRGTGVAAQKCFTSNTELRLAVEDYVNDPSAGSDVAATYGWPIRKWCVKNLDDFSYVFWNLATFDESLADWDMRKATNTEHMFMGATSFNGEIEGWDLRNVENAESMFMYAESMNRNLVNWTMPKVANTRHMFDGSKAFDQNLCRWVTHNQFGTQADLPPTVNGMFVGTSCPFKDDPDPTFDSPGPFCHQCFKCFEDGQELRHAVRRYDRSPVSTNSVATKYGWPISTWCVEYVEDFSMVFADLTTLTIDSLNGWNMTNAKRTLGMFMNARSMNPRIDAWDMSGVLDATAMFRNAISFNRPLPWNTSQIMFFDSFLEGASAFDQDLGSFSTLSVVSMSSMFERASNFQGRGLEKWATKNVFFFDSMFESATRFNNPLPWNVKSGFDFTAMFRDTQAFSGTGLSDWKVESGTYFIQFAYNARSLSTNLCSWRQYLSESAAVDMMFSGSGCAETEDPLDFQLGGPLCSQCSGVPVPQSCRKAGETCKRSSQCCSGRCRSTGRCFGVVGSRL